MPDSNKIFGKSNGDTPDIFINAKLHFEEHHTRKISLIAFTNNWNNKWLKEEIVNQEKCLPREKIVILLLT